jgi:hypothetical protein
MTLTAAALTLWAVRRLTRPVAALAAAADRLGRDVNTPPLRGRPAGGRDRRGAPSTPWPSASAASSATARRCLPPSATT